MQITFYGAAQTVTGSKHLLRLKSGYAVLLDCGMFQGMGAQNLSLNSHLGFDPTQINAVLLSHAHIDHSGLLPLLIKQGYRGVIYSTHATHDLCQLMLLDSAHIQEQDAKFVNKRKSKQNKPHIKPIYTQQDASLALTQFKTVHYNRWIKLNNEVSFMFTDNGHILGAAGISIKVTEDGESKTLFYSGDIGRPHHPILKKPQSFPQADYLIIESTYGNRLHDENTKAQAQLLQEIKRIIDAGKGKIIIPAFSVGRTQEVVYNLDRFISEGKIPAIDVYVDSPLSVNATSVFRKHPEDFNADITNYMMHDDDPFHFSKLHYITDVEDSKALNLLTGPCIIISSSGMTEAGRIKHHIANNVGSADNTILLVGYCPPQTIGGRLADGAPEVRIFGEMYSVKAKVVMLGNFSAHADYLEMIDYLQCQNAELIKKIFLVHGETDVQQAYKQ
ncbi:MAG TPA: MBL fold metallo-hydrolase, partial [Bacteroidia bacterium]|nr:MBL fold metallo-hydrolase [Bacteroidia bacterium]